MSASASGIGLTPWFSLPVDTSGHSSHQDSSSSDYAMLELLSYLLCPLFQVSLKQGWRLLFRKLFPKKPPPSTTTVVIYQNFVRNEFYTTEFIIDGFSFA